MNARRVLLLVLLALGLSGCANFRGLRPAATATPAAPLPRSLKGYELYSWREGGDWRFTLITVTNRLKTYAEITAPADTVTADGWVKITVTGVEALKAVLARLPRGENVLWPSEAWWEQTHRGPNGNLAQPGQALVDGVERHCERSGIELQRVPAERGSGSSRLLEPPGPDGAGRRATRGGGAPTCPP